ncbi:MAG: ATPase, T2SS/T4P/T4SS family [Oscillospiraceae bacterium]
MSINKLEEIYPYLNEKICMLIKKCGDKENIHEIRLRIGKPLCISSFGKVFFIGENGITSLPQNAVIVTKYDLDFSFKAVCEYSIHSFARELSNGFITICGGHRVGICGTAVAKIAEPETIKYITSLNFRVANEVFGAADEIMNKVFKNGLKSTLIIGIPSSGKTTILRDLCRQIGNSHRLSIIDERGEIAAVHQGVPQNNIGFCTDVFDGYSKDFGISIAIRVMSPEIIAVDEIGGEADCISLENSANLGVKILATAHAENPAEAFNRKGVARLLKNGVFEKIVTLGSGKYVGKVVEITEVKSFAEDNWCFAGDCNDNFNRDFSFKKS